MASRSFTPLLLLLLLVAAVWAMLRGRPADQQTPVSATQVSWQATHAVQRTLAADLREDRQFLQEQANAPEREQLARLFIGGLLLAMALVLVWGERQLILAAHDVLMAYAARRLAEAHALRLQDRQAGTVWVPPVGQPYLLQITPGPALDQPSSRLIELQMWRQAALAWLWCADAMGSMAETAFVQAGVCTGPAYRAMHHLLVAAGVIEVRRGKGHKNDTGYVAGWSRQRLLDEPGAALPCPAGQPPRIDQAALADAPQRAATRRNASQESDYATNRQSPQTSPDDPRPETPT